MVLRLSLPRLRWSPRMRLAALGLALGVSALGLSLALLRRRRARPPPPADPFPTARFGPASSRGSASVRRTPSLSSRASTLRGSLRSSRAASSGHAALEDGAVEAELSVEACGLQGVQALRAVIEKLEDALYDFKRFEEQLAGAAGSAGDEASAEGGQNLALMRDLKNLLQEAYCAKERWKQNLILQTDVCDLISDLSREEEDKSSDEDSFVSASEYIDLSDLDVLISQTSQHEHFLYSLGLTELEQGNVSCRSIRTQVVGCQTDAEYLAKVHCLRMAFDHIFADPLRRHWVTDNSKAVCSGLLERLGGSTERFGASFDNMMDFLTAASARSVMSEELAPRGVKRINFYDVVLDLLFLDSFEQLEKPPNSLLSVINNRWLSNGFKRTALESAVWTLLLAKRKLLKRSDGFVAHFYSIIGDVSPALAWGFLGPDEEMRAACDDFKDKLLGAVRSMFSFAHVRYTTVAELADDVFALQQQLVRSLTGADALTT